MLVAVGPGEGDVGQGQAAGGGAFAGGHEQQVPGLDGGNGVVLLAEAGEQVGVRLVGLVQVQQLDRAEGGADHGGQAIGGGDRAHHGANGGGVPAALALGLEAATKIRAAGADAEGVGGAAVLGFVHGEAALVHQPRIAPAQPEPQHGAARGDGQQPVMVAEHHVQLVRLHAAIVGEVDADKALLDVGGNVAAVHQQAADGAGIGGGVAVQALGAVEEGAQHHSSPRRMLPALLMAVPSRSTRPSSMRLRVRVNSMRRAAPSRKKRVRVSLRLSITQAP
ncbi:hypothetical protein FQZ97_741860 [compost metagenome]